MGDNGMLIVGIGLLGGSLLYVSIFLEFLDGDSNSRICLHNCSFCFEDHLPLTQDSVTSIHFVGGEG